MSWMCRRSHPHCRAGLRALGTRSPKRAPIPKRKLKVTLPGPMTICDTIADAHYGRRADMAMAFAELLNAEARELVALGPDTIQFDEPAFQRFHGLRNDWGVAALERAAEGLDCTPQSTSATVTG